MKILLINYSEITLPGGVHKTILELAKNLSVSGHDVTVLQGNQSKLQNEEIYNDFKIIRINSIFSDFFYGLHPEIYFYLKKNMKNIDPDIVHIHGYHTLFSIEIIYLIKKLYPSIPIVFSPHLDTSRGTIAGKYLWNLYNRLSKIIIGKSQYFIADSEFEAKTIKKELGINQNSMSIIPLGVDTFKSNKNVKEKKIKLIYAGYLINRKGVNFILECLYNLVYESKFKNVNLTIIGEGPEEKKLVKMANTYNLEEYITWKSFLPRNEFIDDVMKSDISLLLSNSEAYGIFIAESLALRTSCIVTKKTALIEFLNEPGCYGVDYPPDPKEVVNLIMQINGKGSIAGPFTKKIRSWDKVAQDYAKIYLKLQKEAQNAND